MGKEKTGKRYKGFDDLERRWPWIPDGLVTQILFDVGLPIGVYGSSLYGMCVYGISYGFYGDSCYGDSYYY